MCGIREVYFVSQDPFWFDRVVFELWLQGLSVQEALAHRLNRVHISEQQQLLPLLQIDTAHNYHVFDLLEGSLRRPEGFLTFSPLQIRTNERKEILRGYYSLQSTIAREVAKVGRSANHRIVIKMLGGRNSISFSCCCSCCVVLVVDVVHVVVVDIAVQFRKQICALEL
eukprot:GHVS01027298.1.p1 GENE.GHVS01027298.1~~GHVS01027298.1.p1  ORF type:complete len:169 (+),score=32.28 GHVS01027298.1:2-508(+)